jgi:hypothetical protein
VPLEAFHCVDHTTLQSRWSFLTNFILNHACWPVSCRWLVSWSSQSKHRLFT